MKSISDYESLHSVNLLYFIVSEVDEYIEEKNGNKYLVFAFKDKNNKLLENYTERWDGIKNSIEKISNKPSKCGKYLMKIKFNSDDNLLKLNMLTVIVRSVFEEDGKYYPQVFLDECLYEL